MGRVNFGLEFRQFRPLVSQNSCIAYFVILLGFQDLLRRLCSTRALELIIQSFNLLQVLKENENHPEKHPFLFHCQSYNFVSLERQVTIAKLFVHYLNFQS